MTSPQSPQIRQFAAGHTIFTEGDNPRGEAYLIRSGRVAIRKQQRGEERTIRILEPGKLFGEIALFSQAPRSASALAETEVALFVLPADRVEHYVRNNPELAVDLIRNLCQLLREAEDRSR